MFPDDNIDEFAEMEAVQDAVEGQKKTDIPIIAKPQKKGEHVHKYMKAVIGGEKIVRDEQGKKRLIRTSGHPIMRCMLPGCPHYIAFDLALARKSICWKCGGEMILDKKALILKKPTHPACRKQRVFV